MNTDLPVQPTDLPPSVAAAIARAAERIEKASHEAEYDCPTVHADVAIELITEELRPVWGQPVSLLANGTVTSATPGAFEPKDFAVAWVWDLASAADLTVPRGCVGTRYCHACKVSYGGTCLCLPIKCHHCSAECGTEPPAAGESYKHETHY